MGEGKRNLSPESNKVPSFLQEGGKKKRLPPLHRGKGERKERSGRASRSLLRQEPGHPTLSYLFLRGEKRKEKPTFWTISAKKKKRKELLPTICGFRGQCVSSPGCAEEKEKKKKKRTSPAVVLWRKEKPGYRASHVSEIVKR